MNVFYILVLFVQSQLLYRRLGKTHRVSPRCVENGLAMSRLELAMENGRVLAPFLYAWVSEDECAPDLRGHHSRLRSTAIPPALECRSATRFTPRLRAASRSGDDARPPPTPP